MPPNKMERFTQRARRVLSLAQEEAERLQHNTIGSEHLLLGLLREVDGKGGHVLRDAGLGYEQVAQAVPAFPQPFRGTTLDLSDDTKRVLELATETVRERSQLYIGTEHLLMGILKYPECRAFELLQRFNIDPDDLRQRLLKTLEENPQQASHLPEQEAPKVEDVQQGTEIFTEQARQVLTHAYEEAARLKHSYIGTEHLLLGLMRDENGVAGQVLHDLGLEQPRVEELVKELTRAISRVPSTTLDLTPATKRVLELAVDEARRMGHQNISTAHLLLGFVRQSEGVGIEVLKRLGISPEVVRRAVRRKLKQNPAPTSELEKSAAWQSFVLTKPERLSYSVLESMASLLTGICRMVGENRLTSDQGTEILTSFFPSLIYHDKMRFQCHFETGHEIPDRQCQVVVIDEKTKETTLSRLFLLVDFLNVITGFVIWAIQERRSVTVEFGDGTIAAHLEFQFVEGKE